MGGFATYGEIEGELCALFLHVCEEAGFLVRGELVGEGGGGDEGRSVGQ